VEAPAVGAASRWGSSWEAYAEDAGGRLVDFEDDVVGGKRHGLAIEGEGEGIQLVGRGEDDAVEAQIDRGDLCGHQRWRRWWW